MDRLHVLQHSWTRCAEEAKRKIDFPFDFRWYLVILRAGTLNGIGLFLLPASMSDSVYMYQLELG